MGLKKQDVPQLADWEYNPHTLQKLELPELRKLYTYNRDIAQKRLKRLQKSEFSTTEAALEYQYGIPTIKELTSSSEGDKEFLKQMLVVELADLHKWIENPYSKIGVMKEVKQAQLKTLHEHGYDFVTSTNWKDYVDFRNYLKATGLDQQYSSDYEEDTDTEDPEQEQKNKQEYINRLKKAFELFIKRNGSLPPETFIYK